MRFTIPQFIEHEAKIVGPMTFRQFIYIGVAGAAAFFLYFSASFSVFLISSIVLGVVASSFAFLKIGGKTLPSLLANLLKFTVSPKKYIWNKKEKLVAVLKKEAVSEKENSNEEEIPLKIAGNSQLKKLHTKIETK